MTNIIAVANHKGGVGKTTTSVNIGAGIAKKGFKVLMVDLDPQANLTCSLGFDKQSRSIYQVLAWNDDIKKTIKSLENFDIIPSSFHLAAFEKNPEVGKEFILKERLDEISEDYDYIVIDCPPSLGALTVSALTASNLVLIPLQPEYLALQGMTDFVKIIRTVETRMNPNLDLLGIVMTQFDKRKLLHREVLEYANKTYGEAVFNTKIRGNISLAEAQSVGQDIFKYASSSNGAKDYGNLSEEILIRIEGKLVHSS